MNLIYAVQENIFKLFFPIIFFTALLIFTSCSKDNKTESQGNKPSSDSTVPSKTDSTVTGKKETLTQSEDPGRFMVSYDLEGVMTGKMEILRNGNNLKQKMNSEIMGIPNINTIYILDNSVYSITEAEGQKFATKTDLQEYNSRKQTGETIMDFLEFEKFLSDKKVIGSENILGHNCDIYDAGEGMNVSVHSNKYILKIKSPEFLAIATKLDINPTFAPDEFKLPDNVDFKNSRLKGFDKKALDSALQDLKK